MIAEVLNVPRVTDEDEWMEDVRRAGAEVGRGRVLEELDPLEFEARCSKSARLSAFDVRGRWRW